MLFLSFFSKVTHALFPSEKLVDIGRRTLVPTLIYKNDKKMHFYFITNKAFDIKRRLYKIKHFSTNDSLKCLFSHNITVGRIGLI